MPPEITNFIAHVERSLDITKKRCEHAQFVMGVYATLVLGALGGLLKAAGSASWTGLAVAMVTAGGLIYLMNAAVGKAGTDGVAFRWSMALQQSYPRWRWMIGGVLNSLLIYCWPPLGHFYILVFGLFLLQALVAPNSIKA